MAKSSKWVFFIIAVCVFNSCRNIQPTAPAETATIYGRVKLSQQNWAQLSPPFSGVNVTLEGTNFTAVSDDSGYFTLQNVPTGTYNVRYSKAAYGDGRMMSTIVTGGGNADIFWYSNGWAPILYQISNLAAHLETVVWEDPSATNGQTEAHLLVQGHVSANGPLTHSSDALVLFVSHHSNVSSIPGHYEATFYNAGGAVAAARSYATIDTISGTFSCSAPTQNFLAPDAFKSGDSMYVAVFGAPWYFPYSNTIATWTMPLDWGAGPCDYYDPFIQQGVFTSINQTPSPVIGIKIP